MKNLRLLDLFSGAGGAAMGYRQAGFEEIVGVDIAPQPRYPFVFVQGDALEYLAVHGHEYACIHASPPCQAYSALKHLARPGHPALIEETRAALQAIGRPYVIENVVGAPLRWPLMLCGSMFGLQTDCGAQLRRHRLFESDVLLLAPGHCQHGKPLIVRGDHQTAERSRRKTITVTGATPQQNVERNHIRETFSAAAARTAMGISWMPMRELAQAVPPAYTQWVGRQLWQALREDATP